MKKYLFLAVALMGLVSCEETLFQKEQDVPKINFYEEVMTVEAAGAEEFVELGPGRVLTGLVGKIVGK